MYYPDYESALLKRGAAYLLRAENAGAMDKNKKQADLHASLVDLNRAVLLNGGAEEYFERGWTYYDLGNYTMASNDFKQALAIFPQYPEAYRGLAWVYINQGRYAACASEAEAALKIRPAYDDGLYVKGYCLGYQGDYQAEIDDQDKVLKITPSYAAAYGELGWAYNQMKQYDKAIEALNKAIALNQASKKYDAAPYGNLGYSFLGKGQYKEAIADFKKAIELGSTFTTTFNDLITDAEKKLAEQTSGGAGSYPPKK